jgi:hypothetical protein
MFYNPNRKHTNNGMLSPVDYEIKQPKTNEELTANLGDGRIFRWRIMDVILASNIS